VVVFEAGGGEGGASVFLAAVAAGARCGLVSPAFFAGLSLAGAAGLRTAGALAAFDALVLRAAGFFVVLVGIAVRRFHGSSALG